MRACWLKWVGRDWSISADYIWLNYSDANSTIQLVLQPAPEARVQRPSDSLGLGMEPLRLLKARRTLALIRAVPLLLRMDGRTHQQRSIRPTIGTLCPSTDRSELWNPRDLRGTVFGTRGVQKEKGQRRHRL